MMNRRIQRNENEGNCSINGQFMLPDVEGFDCELRTNKELSRKETAKIGIAETKGQKKRNGNCWKFDSWVNLTKISWRAKKIENRLRVEGNGLKRTKGNQW